MVVVPAKVVMYLLTFHLQMLFLFISSTNLSAQEIIDFRFTCTIQMKNIVDDINKNLQNYNRIIHNLNGTVPENDLLELILTFNHWKNGICKNTESSLKNCPSSNITVDNWWRQIYQFCRGLQFHNDFEFVKYLRLQQEISQEYSQKVDLFPRETEENCGVYVEPDLENLIKNPHLNPDFRERIWTGWHNYIGPKVKNKYRELIMVQNKIAQKSGYNNMADVWQEDYQIENFEETMFQLYFEIEPFYKLLHAVLRHKLYLKYGPTRINPEGPIPIHLLGNMWGQNWIELLPLFGVKFEILPKNRFKSILSIEEFYTSLGFPKMPESFWKYSDFGLKNTSNQEFCRPEALNLFNDHDYRIKLCQNHGNINDFYLLHHEMGHIKYYLLYENQSTIFQDSPSLALHEVIGDVIWLGAMSPKHLNRLNFIQNDVGPLGLLLIQALSTMSQLPFALIQDKYRWDLYRNLVPFREWNQYYWYLNYALRGILPPNKRIALQSELFDAAGKFHVANNLPYIGYFLAGLLKMKIFENMCEISQSGMGIGCDIYGSKRAGAFLIKIMQKGSSISWLEALYALSQSSKISSGALLTYFEPLQIWLENYTETNRIHIGWD